MYLTKEQATQVVQAIRNQSLQSNRAKARAVLDAIGEYTNAYSHFSEDNFLYNANMGDGFGRENFQSRYLTPVSIISMNSQNFVSSHRDLISILINAFGLFEEWQFAPSDKPGWVKVLN